MTIYAISSPPKYCTYITTYFGSKLPMFYIGSGTISKINHPTKPYRGSVSSKAYKDIWQQELKDNPHLFKITILRKFYSRKTATFHECRLQKHLNVVQSDMHINKGYASKNFCGGFNKGKKLAPHTEETKLKIGKANKGKKRTVEQNRKNGERRIGKKLPPRSDEWKQKQSEARKGKKLGSNPKKGNSGAKNGMYKRKRPPEEILKISLSKAKRTKEQNIKSYSRVKSKEEIDKTSSKRDILVCKIVNKKIMTLANFNKHLDVVFLTRLSDRKIISETTFMRSHKNRDFIPY